MRGVLGMMVVATLPLPACDRRPDGEIAEVAAPAELLVSAEWLREHGGDPDVVTLHVGADPDEFFRSHVAGARFLPLSAVVYSHDDLLNEFPAWDALREEFARRGVGDGTRVVLYGQPLHAARAFVALDVLGHRRTALLDGAEHAPLSSSGVDTTSAPIQRGSLAAAVRVERVVDAEWLLEHLPTPELLVIDARDADAYAAGHLPGAVSLPWQRLLASDGRLLPVGELRALFEQLGASPERVLVAYCRSGMQASMTYFVARYLGYDVRLYDGSYVDWTARALPVA